MCVGRGEQKGLLAPYRNLACGYQVVNRSFDQQQHPYFKFPNSCFFPVVELCDTSSFIGSHARFAIFLTRFLTENE